MHGTCSRRLLLYEDIERIASSFSLCLYRFMYAHFSGVIVYSFMYVQNQIIEFYFLVDNLFFPLFVRRCREFLAHITVTVIYNISARAEEKV